MRPLRICLIASSRFPVAEPFAGGLEAHTHALARQLIGRGHDVTLYAGPGSDPRLGARVLDVASYAPSDHARRDVGTTPEVWMKEHYAYLALMMELAQAGGVYDVIHNNSLHHLPVAMAAAVPSPLVTTLHTPPIAWLEAAVRLAGPRSRFVAVSHKVGRVWAHATPTQVICNGVDTDHWRPGPGGERAVWCGRIVPEKAPHLAIDGARRAGFAIDLAGPVYDRGYFDREVEPRLGPDVRVLGHLAHDALADLVGRARVALVTPVWDEPYGLVAAEAMSCGTPVAALRRGALPEIVDGETGRLARPGDLRAFADAIRAASTLDRGRVRESACLRFGLDRMVDEYERLYRTLAEDGMAA